MTQSVAEAVKELRKEIEAGTEAAKAVREIAEEFELNPILLRRKFEESYHSTPEAHAERSKDLPPLPTVSDLAMKEVERWVAQYNGRLPETGCPFTLNGERYLFVVVDGGCSKWGIKAIRVKDAARWQFTLSYWNRVAPQLKKVAA